MSDGTERARKICDTMKDFWNREQCELGKFMTKSQCDMCLEICKGHVDPPCVDHG